MDKTVMLNEPATTMVDLINNLDNRLTESAYDIAWMSRVRDDSGKEARWRDMLNWVIQNQYADGSWGGRMPFAHDRILCTLASLIALKENGVDEEFPQFIERGEHYIWRNMNLLHHDLVDLVGFELILPTLLQEAYKLGLNVPAHTYGYGELRDEKLKLIPLDLLDSPIMSLSLAYSMEYRTDKDVRHALERLQAPHGAIANSPATTAYLALRSSNQNTGALDYLEMMRGRGVSCFYPWTDFEIGWVMQHIGYSGVDMREFHDLPIWQTLLDDLTAQGVGIHETFGIKDGDTTSIVLHNLARAGYDVDPMILKTFEHPENRTFMTFPFERNMSLVTNVHAMEALSYMPDYPERDIAWDAIIRSILSLQKYNTFWVDKWHISPYYATAHTLIALIKLNEHALVEYSNALEWITHTQRPNGSWGYFEHGTSEETAYSVLTLMHYYEFVNSDFDVDYIHHGMEYLYRYRDNPQPHPELYVAKTLYTPIDVVNALIMTTFRRYEERYV